MARENLGEVARFVLGEPYPFNAMGTYTVRELNGVPVWEFWDEAALGPQPDEDAFLAQHEPAWLAAQQTPDAKADRVSYDKRVLAAVIRWIQFRQFGRPMPQWATNTLQAAATKLDNLGIP